MTNYTEGRVIWPPHEVFYIESMLFNTSAALRSMMSIRAVFEVVSENTPDDPISALPVQYILTELQNVIIHAAALSRYFWPVNTNHAWRGVQLRNAFQINDSSPLRPRDLRNSIEHFDERLDDFLEVDVIGHVLPQYVGPFPQSGPVQQHFFRAYYIDSGVFELLGMRYEVEPIAAEVSRLHEALQRMNSLGGRLWPSE
jgi:hypothetical protein